MRFTRIAVALFLVLAACGGRANPDAGGETRYGGGVSSPSAEKTAGGAPTPKGGAPSTAQAPAAGSTTGSSGSGGPVSYYDSGGVGAMARRYLQPSPATRLKVEVDYAKGRRPTTQALEHVESILRRETGKDVEVRADDQIDTSKGSYSFNDIAAFERMHRDAHSAGSAASMWVIYLDGSLSGESGTIGVAITASTAAIFADHIDDAGTAVVGSDQIERAVLMHEIGHLLALVNIGYVSEHDHEDPGHRGHSNSRKSVMYWQIEDKGLVAVITGGPATDFDDDDRDDLEMLRRS